MKQLLQNQKSGKLRIEDVPAPVARPGGVIVRNDYSVVSAGTERATVGFARQSMIGKARARPDLVRQVLKRVRTDGLRSTYRSVMSRLDLDTPLGYSTAGEVVEIGAGVDAVSPGDMVACAGSGYASHAEVIYVPRNLVVKLPHGVSTRDGSFATIGAIAMQGVRRAELTPGETVVVIGLGLLGQITVQILRAYGFPIMGVDIDAEKVEMAGSRGIEAAGVIGRDDLEQIAYRLAPEGIDAAIITAATKTSEPITLAGGLLRERGRVSVVGDVGLDVPRRIYYPKELDVRISRSYGPGRYDPSYEEHGIDYPLPYARWTEQRNMAEFLRLVGTGRVDIGALVTHTFTVDNATDAYRLVVDNPDGERFLGVVLEYPERPEHLARRVDLRPRANGKHTGVLNIGLIGVGNFARGTILPALGDLSGARLRATASAGGTSARDVADRFNADYATSDYREILDDPEIDLVISAGRHNLNGEVAAAALRAGKHVLVEKPLALSFERLADIADAADSSPGLLMVGFNRRFAPAVVAIKDFFNDAGTPLMLHQRVNAGFIPPDSWVHDPVEGGGRILGEACHFVDLLQYLAGSVPTRVHATRLPTDGSRVLPDDNVLITIDFADGSRGSIAYSALGANSQPKEYLEVMGGGRSASLDDYRQYELFGEKSSKVFNGHGDKGHRAEFAAMVRAIKEGEQSPIPLEQLLLTSLVTLLVEESLRSSQPMEVNLDRLTLPDTDPAS